MRAVTTAIRPAAAQRNPGAYGSTVRAPRVAFATLPLRDVRAARASGPCGAGIVRYQREGDTHGLVRTRPWRPSP